MDRSLLTPRLQKVHDSALEFCKQKYGRSALKINEEIDSSISWKPSFHQKANTSLIVAVEVDGTLDPQVLKLAALEILNYDKPIAAVLACPLEVYQNDPDETRVKALKNNGIGIITVDSSGRATLQHHCVPLAQHISAEDLQKRLSGLTPRLKVAFRSAFDTFQINVGQGLQEAGQIVEAIVTCLGNESIRAALISKTALGSSAADNIDALYALPQFKDHRAELGGARSFAKNYRNTASHPARSAKEVKEKISNCKEGFLDALGTSKSLIEVLRKKQFRVVVHL